MNINSVGVIVGRFQVPVPTSAHMGLLEYAIRNYGTVIVFIGHSPILNRLNIIPKDIIKQNIELECENINRVLKTNTKIIVSTIQDVFNPPLWSFILEKQILEICRTNNINVSNIYAVGGRDSYLFSYKGNLLQPDIFRSDLGDEISASAIRQKILKDGPIPHPMFLQGMIYQRLSQYETAFQTVDVAIRFNGAFLLGHRKGITKYRFIGGFSDPSSESLEEDAMRETYEETHLITSDPKYLGSTKIDDARYKNSGDSIKTAFFQVIAEGYGTATFEEPEEENGFDDMPFLRWFKPEDINEDMLVKEHIKLFNILKTKNII